MTFSLLTAGRLTMDPDFRTRFGAAASIYGLEPTDHLMQYVIRANGVGEAAVQCEISEEHPRGVDSNPIEDEAIIEAVRVYTLSQGEGEE